MSQDIRQERLPRVAIIGAGFSGVTLALALAGAAEVQLFEKSRGVGGRMSTRRMPPYQFDHGLPYFSARSPAFRKFLAPLQADGVVQEWQGKAVSIFGDGLVKKRLWFEPHWVACPGMSALVKTLSVNQSIHLETEVAPLTGKGPPWALQDSGGNALGLFDWVISTAPAPQCRLLFNAYLPTELPSLSIQTEPCYALLLGVEQSWPHSWIAAKLHDSALGWIWVDSSKPDRSASRTSLVVHASADWSTKHLDCNQEELIALLKNEVARVSALDLANASVALHRWRYATVAVSDENSYWFDSKRCLFAMGDWSCAPRLESLWIQANQVGKILRERLMR